MQSSPAVKNFRVQLCDKATAFLHHIKRCLDHTYTHTDTETHIHTNIQRKMKREREIDIDGKRH